MILKRLIMFLVHHASIDYLVSSLQVDNPWAMLIAITSLKRLLQFEIVYTVEDMDIRVFP